MRISTNLGLAALLAIGLAGTAHAADRATDRFVYRIQSDAAFGGVEVNRIQRRGDLVLVHGQDRQGRQVVLQRQCGQDRLECPAVQMTARAPSGSAHGVLPLGEGLRSYQTGR